VTGIKFGVIYILFLVVTFSVRADDEKVNGEKGISNDSKIISIWTSEAELGFIQTTGNTETESLNLKFSITNKRQNWENKLKFEASRNADNMGTTAERYFWSFKSRYTLTELSYLFGRIQYEDDRFSGYNYQASEVLGHGWHLVKSDELKINAELGAGIRQNNFEDGTKTSENIIVIASDLHWIISPSAILSEDLSIEIGDDRTINKSVTALKMKINSSLSSKISYTIKHASVVPIGTEKTDTELAVTLVYAFK